MNSTLQATDSGHMLELESRASGRQVSSITAESSVMEAFPILAAPLVGQVELRVRALGTSFDGENLHKLRVALRRLRSLWWAYEPYLNRKDARAQRREFKSLADTAGQTRDWDVLRNALAEQESMKHSFTTLLECIDVLRNEAFICSRAKIESAGAGQLLHKHVGIVVEQLQARGFDESLPAFVRRRVNDAGKSLDSKLQRAIAHQNPEYSELHDLRIAGKKLRYLLEFFLPVLDDCDPANIIVLAGLQDELGKLNDLVASEALLLKHAAQLEDSRDVRRAIRYVGEQKVHHMQNAYALLHAVDRAPGNKRS